MLISLVFFSFGSMNAQILWDLKLEPKPYLQAEPYGKILTTSVKKVIRINEITKDTVSIRKYGKDKKLISEVNFVGSKRSSAFDYAYDKNLEYVTNKIHIGQNSVPQSRTTYSLKGNIKEIYNYSLFEKDTATTYRQWGIFKYDAQDKLIKVSNVHNKDTISVNEYFYEGDKMVKSKMFQHPLKKIETEYRLKYDGDNLPVEIDVYVIKDGAEALESYNHYLYSDKRVVLEKYNTRSKPDEEVKVNYTYTPQGDIQNILLNAGKDTIKVDYKYNNKRQLIGKKSFVTSRSAYKLWVNIPYDRVVQMPCEISESFIYDRYGNLIELMQAVGNVITRKDVFTLEYY